MTDRELDALIAQHLFGYEVFLSRQNYFDRGTPHATEFDANVEYPAYFYDGYANVVLRYSHAPAACALVLDEIERRGWSYVIRFYPAEEYEVSIRYPEKGAIQVYEICTDTRYRAVCLAALAACGVTE